MTSEQRARQRRHWLEQACGAATTALAPASADAGHRSYWRADSGDRSVIVMDSPPDLEDVRPWLRLHALLRAHHVRVPEVLACDPVQGFVLLEDLGTQTYLHLLADGDADALFDGALEQLLRIQAIAAPADLPGYDADLLERELTLFDDWFLGRHLGLPLTAEEASTMAQVRRRLVEQALAQPRILVHRDFMPRNLMPAEGGPAVLDFQDAVLGPIAYDPISLFRDAFISWPEARVEHWLRRYHARAVAAGLPVPEWPRFRVDADWIGVQRHLKVLGIFARLHHRDGKPRYLADAGRFLDYLGLVTPRYDELTGLARLVEQRIRPALAG